LCTSQDDGGKRRYPAGCRTYEKAVDGVGHATSVTGSVDFTIILINTGSVLFLPFYVNCYNEKGAAYGNDSGI
jgi:hypothetical protein